MSRSDPPPPRPDPVPPFAFPIDPHALAWDDATSVLVALAADDLLQEREPVPTILAFSGDGPVASVGLRPFDPGEVGQALLEVLSLLVPLGADRLAFGAAGRVWSLDDPIPPVCPEGDLRQRAIVVALADANQGPCTLTTSVHPFEGTGPELVLHPPVIPDDPTVDDGKVEDLAGAGPVAALLVGALEQREELIDLTRNHELVVQLGRVLLLGHDLALAPDAATHLTAVSSRTSAGAR